MPDTSQLLEVLEYVTTNSEPLEPLAQENIARLAGASKTATGDRVLANLARRNDLTAETRSVIEASPRAAAKSAWLSRTDHPEGYVEAAIAKEKRVTVLAAVAAHPDASEKLIDALAQSGKVKVAEAILTRTDASDRAIVASCVAILDKPGSTNYRQSYAVVQALSSREDLIANTINGLNDQDAIWALVDNNNITVPAASIGKIVRLMAENWEHYLPANAARWSAAVGRYTRVIGAMLRNPHWDTSRSGDALLADIVERLDTIGGGLSPEAQNCLIRHKGSDTQKARALAEELRRKQTIADARETADKAAILRYLASDNRAVINAVAANPNLTCQNLRDSGARGKLSTWFGYLDIAAVADSFLERGEDPVEIAATLMIVSQRTYDRLPDTLYRHIGSDNLAAVGKQLGNYLTEVNWEWGTGLYVIRALGDYPEILGGALPLLTLKDIHTAISSEYTRSEVKEALAKHVTKALNAGLETDTSWKTFIALAEQGEESLERTISVASLV